MEVERWIRKLRGRAFITVLLYQRPRHVGTRMSELPICVRPSLAPECAEYDERLLHS